MHSAPALACLQDDLIDASRTLPPSRPYAAHGASRGGSVSDGIEGLPPGVQIEHKAAAVASIGSGAIPTKDPMEFRIIASVTGIPDLVNDVIEPGAYAATLARRIPKVIKDHDWKQRLGRVTQIKEYPPGDPGLPKKTPRGEPWPTSAGALIGTVRLFNSREGKDAAERWHADGPEQEFSVGYVAKKAWQGQDDGLRHIPEMDLFEISDVLFGAMPLSGSMPVELATKVWQGTEDADADPDGDADPETKVLNAAMREQMAKRGAALPDGSFPIKDQNDLKKAITALGRAKDKDAARAHIVKRAKALKLEFLLPKDWTEKKDSSTDVDDAVDSPPELETKYDTSPVGHGGANWVTAAGGAPPFLRAVAHALIRNGRSESEAIQVAYGTIKRWAGGGGNVTAKTRGKAAATVAWWETHTGAHKELDVLTQWDPTAEVGQFAGSKSAKTDFGEPRARQFQVETKDIPYVSGSQEELRATISAALKQMFGAPDGTYVCLEATFDTWVAVTVYTPASGGVRDRHGQTYRIGYSVADGMVIFDDPTPASLSVVVDADAPVGSDSDYGASMAMAGMESAAVGLKMLTLAPETKAGRVLSGSNLSLIADAAEKLIAVLRAAGVIIETDDEANEPADGDKTTTPAKMAGTETKAEPAAELITPATLHAMARHLRSVAAG
jgi:phage head maturation protease